MRQQTFTVQHAVGLHARPAARFVKLAKTYESKITVRNITRNGDPVDAKSLVRVIKIAAAQHQEVEVTVEGPDEDTAFDGLAGFLNDVPEDEK